MQVIYLKDYQLNLRKDIRGTQDMRYTTLLRIANAIGVTPSELLEGLKTIKED